MVNEFEIKKQICDIGKRIYDRNMVASGNFIRGSMCFLYEKRVEPSGTESTAWLCIWCHGGGVCVVAADTID